MPLHHPSLTPPVEAKNIKDFFNKVCPQVLKLRAEVCQKLGGTYAFVIRGDDGGSWTLDFAETSVKPEVVTKPDLLIDISAQDFLDLLSGKLNVPLALQTRGRLRILGDWQRLRYLSLIFDPAGRRK